MLLVQSIISTDVTLCKS